MRTICLLITSACLLSFSLPKGEWNTGVVVLADGQVITGELQFYPEWQAVCLRTTGNTQTFPRNKLSQFRFFDQQVQLWRKFYTLEAEVNGWKKMAIFEEVIKGKISVFRQTKKYTPVKEGPNKVVSHSDAEKENLLLEQVVDFDYYFSDGETILPLAKLKDYTEKQGTFEAIKEMTKEHHLNWRDQYDLVLIINQLNCSAGYGCLPSFQLQSVVATNVAADGSVK